MHVASCDDACVLSFIINSAKSVLSVATVTGSTGSLTDLE